MEITLNFLLFDSFISLQDFDVFFLFVLDVSNIRPVYGPKDFLEVLINIAMPSRNEELLNQGWGLLTVPIHVKSLNELVGSY